MFCRLYNEGLVCFEKKSCKKILCPRLICLNHCWHTKTLLWNKRNHLKTKLQKKERWFNQFFTKKANHCTGRVFFGSLPRSVCNIGSERALISGPALFDCRAWQTEPHSVGKSRFLAKCLLENHWGRGCVLLAASTNIKLLQNPCDLWGYSGVWMNYK